VSFTVLSAAVLVVLGLLLFAGVQLTFVTGSADGQSLVTVDGRPERRERLFGHSLYWTALVAGLWAGVDGVVPPSVPILVSGFLMGITLVRQVAPGSAAIVARYGVWVVLVSLVGAVAFTPLSTIPIPDITVFGRYTYLVTEIVFGALAFILLLRAGGDALRSAWLTIAVVYPIAYVWDWYTLTVGVFSIPLRTGYVFVGIPIEEHLFMIVVPGLVLAVHETRRSVRTE